MTSQYKTYPKYKNSGIKWIGEIPEGWEVHKLKYLLSTLESGSRETGGGNQLDEGIFSLGGEHINWDGTLNLENSKLISEEYYNSMNQGKLKINDILLVKDGATIGKTAILIKKEFEKMAINEHVFLMRSNKRIDYKLLYYSICGDSGFKQIKLTEVGSAQGGINQDFIAKVYFSVPGGKQEQTVIANFLDKKTAKIDALIEKNKKLIGLLKEKRAALINHAVTKGLDPNANMKDSGIDWIGEIPEGWEVKKLKTISKIVLGKMLTNEDKGDYELKPYLRAQNILWEVVDTVDIKNMWFSKSEINKYKLKKDDLLVSEGGEAGRTAIWNGEVSECYIQNSVHKITINNQNFPRYIIYLFESYGKKGIFESIVSRVSIAHLTREKLKEIYCVIPPLPEQATIVNFLDKATAKMDKTIQKIEQKIKLLEEYKKSLIYHTVTGKIDIRGSGI